MKLEKVKKFGVALTKDGSREKNRKLANVLISQYGLSLAFSRRREDGGYENAAKIVYPSGHEEPIGKFTNIFVSTEDHDLVQHANSCLENSYQRAQKFNTSNSGGSDLDDL